MSLEQAKAPTVFESIGLYNLLCLIDDVRHINPDDMFRASLDSEHAENGSSTPNIQHRLATEEVRVVVHGVTIRQCTDFILQHFFVNTYVPVSWIRLSPEAICGGNVDFRIRGGIINAF
jgi:hypothetical protein